ncbi:DUF3152 domain-containing protein [Nocardioides sp. Root190]|uniref:DUF3152 domain-containing protein n=1 Tax=Nocardioides sp. Root190 TaxID=1736488 RepID=UPI00138F1509|nr:DUF3152 domain-containing protein [Nocardioides sp. Root190]
MPTAHSTDVAAAQAADIETDASRGSSNELNQNVPPAGDGAAKLIVPERGSGRFAVAPGASVTSGRGNLVTYSVEIESDLDLPLVEVARLVDETLADRRGWTAVAGRALRRVSANPMIRIRIATPETADRLCAPLDTGGRLSCRNGENVVLNAWRWANGAGGYERNLANYRRYLINHEVGHALGFDHASCPGPGAIAPAMLQQTKGLDGCTPNPWPATGGAR